MKSLSVRQRYSTRYKDYLCSIAEKLEKDIRDNVSSYPRIDRVCVRPKSVARFCAKAKEQREGGKPKYNDPIRQIQDQIGARIVTYYPEDVARVSEIVEQYYTPIEKQNIVPDSEREFGYEDKHYIMFIPDAILPVARPGSFPKFFELQVRTLFQHAWAEAEHDLGYKPKQPLKVEDRRKIAFTAAQAWGADTIFQELFTQFSRKRRAAE
jgi:ppGpp synthetase/RelA/SpoT-type nucleotidyltranferase